MGFFNEIDALKDHALEPFQNEPGKRRFVQIVFVLLCAAVGVVVAAVWLGSWEIGPPTMEFVRLCPSYRPLIHFRRHLGNGTFKSELTAVIAVFVRNFANCSRVLMTKNSSARSRKSRSSMIWNDGFSVKQRQLSTNWRLTLTVAPYYWP
jgi:hypothetical protein